MFLNLSPPTGAAVKGLNDATTFVLGPFYQGQLLPLRIYPVISTGAVLPTSNQNLFSKVSLTNLDLQVVVGPRAGAESILAAQYTWSKQVANDSEGKSGYFYANLDLNTTNLNTAISTSDSYSTYIEFELSRSGATFAPVYQAGIQILAVVKDPGGAASAPTPATSYLTAAQCYNLFVAWRNDLIAANAGRNVVFLAPGAAHTRELGVGDSGEPIDNAT